MYPRTNNCQWMTQNTWIILSRRLYFEMRYVVSPVRSVREFRSSRNLGLILLARKKSLFSSNWQKFRQRRSVSESSQLVAEDVNASSTPKIFFIVFSI